jgi:CheY-like chemotaxis protein
MGAEQAIVEAVNRREELLLRARGLAHKVEERALRLLEPATRAEPDRTESRPVVLVVDDVDAVRRSLARLLRQAGFAVLTAGSGREALALYREQRHTIAAVLLDVCMPGLDGPQTLAALRLLNPRVRCCFMSADTGSYQGAKLLALGAARVLTKPFQPDEVTGVLWQLVRDQGVRGKGAARRLGSALPEADGSPA